jgi:hypothetical protein
VFEATTKPRDPAGTVRMLVAAALSVVLGGVVTMAALAVWALWWFFVLLWALLWPPRPAIQLLEPVDMVELMEPEPLHEEQLQLAEADLYDVDVPAPPSDDPIAAAPDQLAFPDRPSKRAPERKKTLMIAMLRTRGASDNAGVLSMLNSSAELDGLFTSGLDGELEARLSGTAAPAVSWTEGGFSGLRTAEVGGGDRYGAGTGGGGSIGAGRVGRVGRGAATSGSTTTPGTAGTYGGSSGLGERPPTPTHKVLFGSSNKTKAVATCAVQVEISAGSDIAVVRVEACDKRLHKDASAVVHAKRRDWPHGTHSVVVTLTPK